MPQQSVPESDSIPPSADAEQSCLNCGTRPVRRYCPECGQHQDTHLRSGLAVVRGMVSELTDLDARVVRTLATLIRQPGVLTLEYLRGRRARFVPPFRLYLAVSAVYFAIFWATESSRFFIFWASGPDPAIANLVRLLPKLMFVMLPIFAAYLWLAYPRRYPYEAHFVFALHYHSFAFAVLSGVSLLQPFLRRARAESDFGAVAITAGIVSTLLEISVMVYLYLALRRVYSDSKPRTAFKAAAVFAAQMAAIAVVGALTLPSVRAMVWRAIASGT